MKPPVATIRPEPQTVHGITRPDDYRHLQERSPETMAYITAENAYAASVLEPYTLLASSIAAELRGHLKEDETTVAIQDGPYDYYSRAIPGQPYDIHLRRHRDTGVEELLLDENVEAAGYPFFELDGFLVSDDHTTLAYTVDTTGYRQYDLVVRDIATGTILPMSHPRVTSMAFAPDNTLYLTTESETTKRSDTCIHLTPSSSRVVYHEPDEEYCLDITVSADRRHFFIESTSTLATEMRIMPRSGGTPTIILPRRDEVEYYVDAAEDTLFILTNDGAPNFRLFQAPIEHPDRGLDLVSASDTTVEDFGIFARHITVQLSREGSPSILVIDRATLARHTIDMPGSVYNLEVAENPEYDIDTVNLTCESPVLPARDLRYNMATRVMSVQKDTCVPNYNSSLYHTRRLYVTARDGTQIPVVLTRRNDTPEDGTAPAILTAYGAYGDTRMPEFSINRLPLLDRGVVWCTADVRGGGEMGPHWAEQGRREHKINTFTDFIDVAAYLTSTVTRSDRLAIRGRSAGGLLMGGVVNMRPDLFAAAVIDVPFVDVLNTMLSPDLPLTTLEYNEWGDPNDPVEYSWMAAYSPYDNVKAQDYPAILLTTGMEDSQVPYWEAVKFAARLRANKTGTSPLLLRTHMTSGHGGPSNIYEAFEETAWTYAFIWSTIRPRAVAGTSSAGVMSQPPHSSSMLRECSTI